MAKSASTTTNSWHVGHFRIEGESTLMHNGQGVSPFNEYTIKIRPLTAKRKKTEEDLLNIMRLEFLSGLYLDDKGHPCWPGTNIHSMLVSAAKRRKLGTACKSGLLIRGDFPLEYEGPKDKDKLWAAGNKFVHTCRAVVSGRAIMRCRPIFHNWALNFDVHFSNEVIDFTELKNIVVDAGKFVGLSDFRPQYGSFRVTAASEEILEDAA
jgi:hypothetical protein